MHSAISVFALLVFFYPDLLAGFISIIVAFSYVVHKTPQEFMGYFKGARKRDPQIVSLLLKELNFLASTVELSCSSENQRQVKIDGITALLFSGSTDKLSNSWIKGSYLYFLTSVIMLISQNIYFCISSN